MVKHRVPPSQTYVDWNQDDEVVETFETGILTVKELGEVYGLTVHDLFSNPSKPELRVQFITRN